MTQHGVCHHLLKWFIDTQGLFNTLNQVPSHPSQQRNLNVTAIYFGVKCKTNETLWTTQGLCYCQDSGCQRRSEFQIWQRSKNVGVWGVGAWAQTDRNYQHWPWECEVPSWAQATSKCGKLMLVSCHLPKPLWNVALAFLLLHATLATMHIMLPMDMISVCPFMLRSYLAPCLSSWSLKEYYRTSHIEMHQLHFPSFHAAISLQLAVPDLVEASGDADILVFVIPHQFIGKACDTMKGKIKSDALGISLIKVWLCGIVASSEEGFTVDVMLLKGHDVNTQ